jgi:hypothetical protein
VSSNNKFEVLGNLEGSVNPENMKKEVEEEQTIDLNSGLAHLGNGTDPSPEDPVANAQEEEERKSRRRRGK